MFHVYILRCADRALYVGHTADVSIRLREHDEGRVCHFTARRRPVALVYEEAFTTRQEAARRERQIKRWTRRKKEALIAGNSALLNRL